MPSEESRQSMNVITFVEYTGSGYTKNHNWKYAVWLKNEQAPGILKFGNFCEFLRFLETFWLLFVFFLLNFAPKKVC